MKSIGLRIAGSLMLLTLCIGSMGGCALLIRDCSQPQSTTSTNADADGSLASRHTIEGSQQLEFNDTEL